jgi:hypothetical protein
MVQTLAQLDAAIQHLLDAAAGVRDAYSSSPPSMLYHYTDAAGARGILEEGAIWATHALFMNDRSELSYVDRIVTKVAEELLEHASSRTARDTFEVLSRENWLNGGNARPVYVTSLSTHRDQLSQWRAYANDGLGYAIGFATDQEFHVQQANHLKVRLVRVSYEPEEQEHSIRLVLTLLLDALGKARLAPDKEAAIVRGLTAANKAVQTMGFAFKNHGFHEEDEWRLVVEDDEFLTGGKHVCHRATGFGLTPYLSLGCASGLPVREVVLGPRLQEPQAMIGVMSLLVRQHFNVLDVTSDDCVKLIESEASYRGGR